MSDDETVPPTEFALDVVAEVKFDARDICRQLTPLQVVDLIEEIDEERDNWATTLMLYHHFKAQYDAAMLSVPDWATKSYTELEQTLIDDENAEKEIV